jgi:hypothetical protein
MYAKKVKSAEEMRDTFKISAIKISVKKITLVLALTTLFLTLASLAARFFAFIWGQEGLLALLTLLNTGEEASIPTWYSSFLFLLCSVLLATVAAVEKRYNKGYIRHWRFLAVIFILLSIDEVATIHETGGDALKSLAESAGFAPSGFIYQFWVVPAAAFVFLIALAYSRFLANLPARTLILFLTAGTTFVIGAIGMEMLSARLISFYGEAWDYGSAYIPTGIKLTVGLQSSIEEFLETLGTLIFVYALLSYLSSSVKQVTVEIGDDNE